jgi:tRNA A-37 threonylcarbamoyl transferase component Bud32
VKKDNLQEISTPFKLKVKGINIQTRVLNHKDPKFKTRTEHRFWTTEIMSRLTLDQTRDNVSYIYIQTHTHIHTPILLPVTANRGKCFEEKGLVTGPHQRQIVCTYCILETMKAE